MPHAVPFPFRTELLAANGLVFDTLACGDPASDRLALCLHGFPEINLSWCEQMPVLAAMGYRVWAPNQRGYGRSTRPGNVAAYAIEELLADVAGLIDASGAREVVLLAHDWGAIVAWTFAARQLRPLHKLVIINVPHPVLFARALRRQPGQMLRSWYALFFQLPRLPEWLLGLHRAQAIETMILRTSTSPETFPRDLLEATRANAAQPGALTAMLHWYRAFLRGGGLRRQLRLGFPAIEIPTLLLWGEQDTALAKSTTYGTEAFAPRLTTIYLPGVSHWVQQDATTACNGALQRFLAR